MSWSVVVFPDYFPLALLQGDTDFLRTECLGRGIDPRYVDGIPAVLRAASARGPDRKAVTSLVDDFRL